MASKPQSKRLVLTESVTQCEVLTLMLITRDTSQVLRSDVNEVAP